MYVCKTHLDQDKPHYNHHIYFEVLDTHIISVVKETLEEVSSC